MREVKNEGEKERGEREGNRVREVKNEGEKERGERERETE